MTGRGRAYESLDALGWRAGRGFAAILPVDLFGDREVYWHRFEGCARARLRRANLGGVAIVPLGDGLAIEPPASSKKPNGRSGKKRKPRPPLLVKEHRRGRHHRKARI